MKPSLLQVVLTLMTVTAAGILPLKGVGAVRSAGPQPITIPWQFPGPASLGSPVAPAATVSECPHTRSICIYEAGGFTRGTSTGTTIRANLRVYEPLKNDWISLKSLPDATEAAGMTAAPCVGATARSCVYTVGGNTPSAVLATIHAYDATTNTWGKPFQLDLPAIGVAAAAGPCFTNLAETCLYALGGNPPPQGSTDLAQMFNPADGSHTDATPIHVYSKGLRRFINFPRADAAATTAPCLSDVARACIYVIGGAAGGSPQSSVLMYDPSLDNGSGTSIPGPWTRVPDLPTPVTDSAAVTAPCRDDSGTCIFVMGGFTSPSQGGGVTPQSAVEQFDPRTGAWTDEPHLNESRYSLGGAAAPCPESSAQTCLFAVGGAVGPDSTTASIEALPPGATGWQLSTNLDPSRDLAGVVTAPCAKQPAVGAPAKSATPSSGRCIYSVGGLETPPDGSAGSMTDAVDMFSPASGGWNPSISTPKPVAAAGVAAGPCVKLVSQTCIYVLGGYGTGPATSTGSAYLFDPAIPTWIKLPSLPSPRALLAATSAPCRGATTRTCVYAMGGANLPGHGSNPELSSAFMFDPKTKTWSSVAPTPSDEGASAASGPCLANVRNTCIYLGPGIDTGGLEMYDPRTNIWLPVAPSLTGHARRDRRVHARMTRPGAASG